MKTGIVRAGLFCVATFAFAGCSLFGSDKPKMADLQKIDSPREVELLWEERVGRSDRFALTPLVDGNSVFAAANDGTVARYDNGQEVWRVKAESRLSGGVGGDSSRVVVGSTKGDIFVFDASDGQLQWQAKVSSEVLAPPAVDASLVIVKSGDNRLYAFNAINGERKWIYQRATPVLSVRGTGQPVISQGHVFAGFPGGKLVAVNLENGVAVWEGTVSLPRGATELDRIADIVSAPVIDGELICAVAYQGRTTCFNLVSGSQVWSRDISSSVGLTIDYHYVYVTDDKGAVYALDRENGANAWKQDKLHLRSVSGPVAQREWIAVGDVAGMIHFLNREDGSFIARTKTDGSRIQAPLKKYGSGLLVQTQRGGLLTFRVQ